MKPGDRVTMQSALQPTDGSPPPWLRGTVERWPETGGLIVRWDDWPCVTALPNGNVHPCVELEALDAAGADKLAAALDALELEDGS